MEQIQQGQPRWVYIRRMSVFPEKILTAPSVSRIPPGHSTERPADAFGVGHQLLLEKCDIVILVNQDPERQVRG